MWFQTYLITPMLNALIWLYDVIPGHDFGVAIILLTLIIKAILFWPSLSAIKAQHQLQDIQPKIDAIRKKYPNKEEQSRKLMEFYKENKVNPFSSCLPLLIQLPIIYALFRVFLVMQRIDHDSNLLSAADLGHLYGWLKVKYATATINPNFLGFIDLAATKNYVLAILSGALSFVQAKMMITKKPQVSGQGTKDESISAIMSKQTTFVLPVITVLIGISLPAGITLYWLASTVFTIVQQWYFIKFHKHPTVNEELKKV